MYDAFYGFTSEPFRLSPDAKFCFRHRSFSKAKSYFNYALNQGEGFVLVTGRPGTGKTTLIEDLLKDLAGTGILPVRVDSGQVQADDLLRRVAYAFGVEGSGVDKATLLHRLEHYLHQRVREKGKALLIVDEAQALPADALEELRLITNLTNSGQPLVQIFLVGQEALRDTISAPALEQLHQRILCACHLDPLPLREMRDYLAHRLKCAGWRGDPVIEVGAIRALHHGSGGIPRLINKVADRLLLHGGLEEKHVLNASDADHVLEELRAELLLKEADELLPVKDEAESNIRIEDVRLVEPPAVSKLDLDQSPEIASVREERADNPAAEVTGGRVPGHPDDLRGPHPVADRRPVRPRQEPQPPTTTARTPVGFAEVFPAEEFNGAAYGGAVPAHEDRSGHAVVDKASERVSSNPWRPTRRRTKRRRIGVMLAVLLLTALGAGLFLMRDRLRLVSGQKTPNGEETVVIVNGSAPAATSGSTMPDSEQDHVVVVRAPQSGQTAKQAVDGAPDNAPGAALVPESPEPVAPLPETQTEDSVDSRRVTDTSAEPAGSEPDSVVPDVTSSAPGSEGGAMSSAEEIRAVSIASGRTIEPLPELRVGGISPEIAPSVGAGPMESSGMADSGNRDERPEPIVIESAPVASIAAPEVERSSVGGSAGNPASGNDVLESASLRVTGSTKAPLADLVEAVQTLGIEPESVEPNQVRLILRNAVVFDFDSARVPADAYEMLDRLAAVFVKHGDVRVRIVGHTDHIGGADYNRLLSARRAAAIQRQLVFRGVAADRLTSSGQGEDKPLVPLPPQGAELSRDERIANRRIELWIEPIGGN